MNKEFEFLCRQQHTANVFKKQCGVAKSKAQLISRLKAANLDFKQIKEVAFKGAVLSVNTKTVKDASTSTFITNYRICK